MDRLIEFFARNPILLLVGVVWLFGVLGNLGKAARQARERAEAARRRQEAGGAQPGVRGADAVMRPAPAQSPQPQPQPQPMDDERAQAVAREMRRILGIEPEAREEARQAPPVKARPEPRASAAEPVAGDRRSVEPPTRREPVRPAPVRREPSPPLARRNVAAPERAPAPVQPTSGRRRLEIHVDPHVGESIGKRARVGSGKVGEHALGGLGGRAPEQVQRAVRGARYELDDLKRAFVLSEILGPPLASRPERRDG